MALKVKISGDGSGFEATLKKLEEQAGTFGKNLNAKVTGNLSEAVLSFGPALSGAIAGVFAGDQIAKFVKDFADQAHSISMGAMRLNIDPTSYQQFANVLRETGMNVESLEGAFDHLADTVTKINRGDEEAHKLKQAMLELGVSLEDIKRGDYQHLMHQIFTNMQGIRASAAQISAMKDIFGRSGVDLLPAMQVGLNSYIASKNLISEKDLEELEHLREIREEGSETYLNLARGAARLAVNVWTGLEALGSPKAWADAFQSQEQRDRDAWVVERTREIMEHVTALKKVSAAEEDWKAKRDKDNAKWNKDDWKHAAELDKEVEKLKEKNALDDMSPKDKRSYLEKQLADAREVYDAGVAQGFNSETNRAEWELKIESLKGQIAALDRDALKRHHGTLSSLGNQSIGGIMLGHDLFRDMPRHMQEAAKHLASIDKKTKPNPSRGANRDFH